MTYRQEVTTCLERALQALGVDSPVSLEDPPGGMGDWAFPCFPLAKILKKNPAEIASEIASTLDAGEGIVVSSKGPYVNFTVEPDELGRIAVEAFRNMGDDFGKGEHTGVKITVEHTSANPTDRLHVGRARNPIIGDTLARLLRFVGHDVETQYYVDDMGRQAVVLALGIEKRKDKDFYGVVKNRYSQVEDLGDYQYGNYITSDREARNYLLDGLGVDTDEMLNDWIRLLERGDPEIAKMVQAGSRGVMDLKITPTLERINTTVDRFTFESQFVVDGTVRDVIDRLKETSPTNENEAYFIELEPYGITGKDTRFFYTREDGTSLYTTRDLAYHLWKMDRCDMAINVLGEDHKLQARKVAIGLGLLGQDRSPECIFYSFVRLPEGKMSTRSGQVVFMDDLLDEAVLLAKDEVRKRRDDLDEERVEEIAEAVGIGAVRYNIIRIQPEKPIVFKWEEALNFEGNSAPFIQYAHARCCSILRKAQEEGKGLQEGMGDWALLDHPSEQAMVRMLALFPSRIREAAESRRTHQAATAVQEIAVQFNQFYRDCQVLVDDMNIRNARLELVNLVRTVLRSGLEDILGIAAPETM